jgi:subtilisin family serine protease
MGEDYYTMYQAKEWAGIRIHIFGDHITAGEDLPEDKVNFLVHKLAPTATAWLNQALSVVPVKGQLRMGARGASCAGLSIPNAHRSPGVEADVIFYLSAEKTAKGELGWSKPCFIDQFGRPTAARINLSPCYLDPTATGKAWDRQVAIFLHEAIHALGFDSFSFSRFRDAFDPRVSLGQAVKPFYEKRMQVNKIVTPRATEAARAHFGCPKMTGLPLENQERAPVLGGGSGEELVVDPETGCVRYIVKFKADTSLHRTHEIQNELLMLDNDAEQPLTRANVTGNFSSVAFKGLVACLTVPAVEWVRSVPEVLYVEADAVVSMDEIQSGAVWGLDRLDGVLDGNYEMGDFTGEGVVVFILDTGVNSRHEDLEGRVLEKHYFSAFSPTNGEDCQGHGSHCAGTVAGTKHGVAKKAEIVSVRVLGCDGSGARTSIVDGILHCIKVMQSAEMEGKRGVLSMSLGGPGYSQASQDAIEAAIEAGMPVLVAAGNDASDACSYTPAAIPAAVTVGASDDNDIIAGFSNWGTCVDIFAPGVAITSADWLSEQGYKDLQGTSMACPHVAGVAALFLQQNPEATGEQIQEMILVGGMPGVVKQAPPQTTDLLLKVPTGTVGAIPTQLPKALKPDEPRPPQPEREGEAGEHDDPSWDLPEPPAPPVVVPHLEARLFKGELMTPHSPEEVGTAVSIFTLAVLEDSGWYKANYSLSQPLPWGRQTGCRFVTDQCISDPAGYWPGVPTNYSVTVSERHFCMDDGRVGCTVDRTSKAVCDVTTHKDDVPKQFQYFLNAKKRGGRNGFADFCPVYEALPPNSGGDCTDDTIAVGGSDFLFGEKYGVDARCFVTYGWMRALGSLSPPQDSPRTARCFRHECTSSGVLLHFPEGATNSGGAATVLCPKSGGAIDAPSGFMGTIDCPEYDELCARSPLNGCPNDCSGKGTCLMGKCFCDPGAMGEDCAGTICENNCHADKLLGYCTSHTRPPSCWCRTQGPVAADCSPLAHFTNGMPLLAILPAFVSLTAAPVQVSSSNSTRRRFLDTPAVVGEDSSTDDCSADKPCGSMYFCNFDNEKNSTCEACPESEHTDGKVVACFGIGLSSAGEQACASTCTFVHASRRMSSSVSSDGSGNNSSDGSGDSSSSNDDSSNSVMSPAPSPFLTMCETHPACLNCHASCETCNASATAGDCLSCTTGFYLSASSAIVSTGSTGVCVQEGDSVVSSAISLAGENSSSFNSAKQTAFKRAVAELMGHSISEADVIIDSIEDSFDSLSPRALAATGTQSSSMSSMAKRKLASAAGLVILFRVLVNADVAIKGALSLHDSITGVPAPFVGALQSQATVLGEIMGAVVGVAFGASITISPTITSGAADTGTTILLDAIIAERDAVRDGAGTKDSGDSMLIVIPCLLVSAMLFIAWECERRNQLGEKKATTKTAKVYTDDNWEPKSGTPEVDSPISTESYLKHRQKKEEKVSTVDFWAAEKKAKKEAEEQAKKDAFGAAEKKETKEAEDQVKKAAAEEQARALKEREESIKREAFKEGKRAAHALLKAEMEAEVHKTLTPMPSWEAKGGKGDARATIERRARARARAEREDEKEVVNALKEGDIVEVHYHRDRKYYSAKLGKRQANGWDVIWDTGQRTPNVKEKDIRKKGAANKALSGDSASVGPAGAIARCRQMVAENPDNAPHRVKLGVALEASGDLKGALSEFRTAVTIAPKYGKGHKHVVRLVSLMGAEAEPTEAEKKAVATAEAVKVAVGEEVRAKEARKKARREARRAAKAMAKASPEAAAADKAQEQQQHKAKQPSLSLSAGGSPSSTLLPVPLPLSPPKIGAAAAFEEGQRAERALVEAEIEAEVQQALTGGAGLYPGLEQTDTGKGAAASPIEGLSPALFPRPANRTLALSQEMAMPCPPAAAAVVAMEEGKAQ